MNPRRLVNQPQRELHEPGLIGLRTDHAELRDSERLTRESELHTVGNVEEFRPELQSDPLGDGRVLEQRHVEVFLAVSPQDRIGPARRAEGE